MRRSAVALKALLASSVGCTPALPSEELQSPPSPATTQPSSFSHIPSQSADAPRDPEDILAQVLPSLEAGLVDHDAERFLSIFANDAQLILSRVDGGGSQGSYETMIDREHLAARARMKMFRDKRQGPRTELKEIELDVASGPSPTEASLRFEVHEQGAMTLMVRAEEYRLALDANGWQVIERRVYRTWEELTGQGRFTWTAAAVAELDADVDEAKTAGDLGKIAVALERAERVEEAYAAAQHATTSQPDSAVHWLRRAHLAEQVGEREDAERSHRQVLKLRPTHRPPQWLSTTQTTEHSRP